MVSKSRNEDLKITLLDLDEMGLELDCNVTTIIEFFYDLIEEKEERVKEVQARIIANQLEELKQNLSSTQELIKTANQSIGHLVG